jgi:hypothetical protein
MVSFKEFETLQQEAGELTRKLVEADRDRAALATALRRIADFERSSEVNASRLESLRAAEQLHGQKVKLLTEELAQERQARAALAEQLLHEREQRVALEAELARAHTNLSALELRQEVERTQLEREVDDMSQVCTIKGAFGFWRHLSEVTSAATRQKNVIEVASAGLRHHVLRAFVRYGWTAWEEYLAMEVEGQRKLQVLRRAGLSIAQAKQRAAFNSIYAAFEARAWAWQTMSTAAKAIVNSKAKAALN